MFSLDLELLHAAAVTATRHALAKIDHRFLSLTFIINAPSRIVVGLAGAVPDVGGRHLIRCGYRLLTSMLTR